MTTTSSSDAGFAAAAAGAQTATTVDTAARARATGGGPAPTPGAPERRWSRFAPAGRVAAVVGALLLIGTPYLPWAYAPEALDDMTYTGGPSGLQLFSLIGGVTLLVLLLAPFPARRFLHGRKQDRVNWNRGARAAAIGATVYLAVILAAIALELGGLVNVQPGGWLAFFGAGLALAGTLPLPRGVTPTLQWVRSPHWLQILGIVASMAGVLLAAAYGLGQDDGGSFIAFAVFLGSAIYLIKDSGVLGWLSTAAAQNRKVLVLSAFVTAFAFPFTQNGSDANMSIASQVLIFAATAMGLNIVVGLAGLLDLGYIAFLGAGAFTAATLSTSAFATINWHPPFIVVVLISGAVSATLGLIIGSPTLRVSGDYLAIVTLAFGEIFRITMNNLDGQDGPNLTHGSNGIPGIPNLAIFGFDFGKPHDILGVTIGRFSNYYWLMLLVLGLIILVFTNLNHSRIGRGWVAIREDERAAEAMGVNVFGLKLLAFAGGAFLAGVAGAVKAHQDVSVTPDQYIFMESAFLVAGIVLGGMGTVGGVLVGASILKLLPEKLRFFQDYRLLMFGILLVVMMRIRPEGLMPDERRQLEFHDEDEELADEIGEDLEHHVVPSLAGAQAVPERRKDHR
ncbi:branched-chain amino acid ABC transporter permease [Raineyella sp. W15-4]|uniref:branched-chain amino acid ABC transporter permease n=1 Tax=Raineyella sp. W15-4 TaxID=3081651 RepID=UPI0029532D2D|nr:branched-chain amino acid ABC transporter permease [Raineyella sp. W15-4]WOQ17563.1 branched-chain amino acid ABC transporter permease [Raineyella sp. W15-4]